MNKKEKQKTLLFYKSEIRKLCIQVYKLRRCEFCSSSRARLRTLLADLVDVLIKSSEIKGCFKKDIRDYESIKARMVKVENLISLINDLDNGDFTKQYKKRVFCKYVSENWY